MSYINIYKVVNLSYENKKIIIVAFQLTQNHFMYFFFLSKLNNLSSTYENDNFF